jgi:hypothetical protein
MASTILQTKSYNLSDSSSNFPFDLERIPKCNRFDLILFQFDIALLLRLLLEVMQCLLLRLLLEVKQCLLLRLLLEVMQCLFVLRVLCVIGLTMLITISRI